ncbi:MAG: FHA domain-containing protein [Acidimicrobiia bacterium]|nr:FHA domain-containing protein [Acidimicrobiia bacterium]
MEIGSTDNDGVHRGLFLTVAGVGDRVVFADPRGTVGDVIRGLGGSDGDVLAVHRTGNTLLPTAALGIADIRSGDVVTLEAGAEREAPVETIGAVTVAFLSGPKRGEQLILPPGESRIGRAADNDIIIVDPGVSRYHATVTVDSTSVILADAGSTNGVLVGDEVVTEPVPLTSGERVLVGQTWFAVTFETAARADLPWGDGEADARRVLVSPGSSPYRPYGGERIIFPSPPERSRGWRRSSHEGFEAAANLYDRSLQSATATLVKELDAEWTARLAEAPSIGELVDAVNDDIHSVWRRADSDPLITRIGLAALPSRIRCTVPDAGDPELRERAEQLLARYHTVDGVPVTVDFSSSSSVLVAGQERESRELAYSLLAQLVLQHQPNRLRIWSLISPGRVERWDWLKWLPHCDGFADDGSFTQLTADPDRYRAVVDRLAASANGGASRTGYPVSGSLDGPMSAVLLIDGEAQIPNSVQAMIESLVGGDVRSSVTALVVGQCDPAHQLELPFGRRGTVVTVDREYASMESVVDRNDPASRPAVLGIDYELYTDDEVGELARRLTCLEPFSADASAEVRTATPSMFWTEAGPSFGGSNLDGLVPGADPAIVVEQWAGEQPPGRLAARIGRNKTGSVNVDIRELGPHALISGDLEGFLPAWIAALALRYGPDRLNFYLIDSTGGAVFRSCRELPHTIGNLSDTSTLEIKPALAMLSAELDRREALLTTFDCNSIEDLERLGRPNAFPYLVVCIDRVEALGDRHREAVVTLDPAAELLSLAERGQQLGMHLLLGSAGPVDRRLDERIALRINTARYGPSHLTVGQAPVVSFTATLTSQPPEVVVRSFRIDDTTELSRELLPVVDLDDLERLTTLIRNAHEFSGSPLPSGLG